MITLLFEQPWIIGSAGTIVTGMTLYGWLQTGNVAALRLGIGLAIATLCLLIVNLAVVTDTEQVRSVVLDIASELQRNEREKVLARIHPHPSENVEYAIKQLPSVEFEQARITAIHNIKIDRTRVDVRATVRMNVSVIASRRGGKGKALRWVEVSLDRVDNKWLVSDFTHRDPQHEFINDDGPYRGP